MHVPWRLYKRRAAALLGMDSISRSFFLNIGKGQKEMATWFRSIPTQSSDVYPPFYPPKKNVLYMRNFVCVMLYEGNDEIHQKRRSPGVFFTKISIPIWEKTKSDYTIECTSITIHRYTTSIVYHRTLFFFFYRTERIDLQLMWRLSSTGKTALDFFLGYHLLIHFFDIYPDYMLARYTWALYS